MRRSTAAKVERVAPAPAAATTTATVSLALDPVGHECSRLRRRVRRELRRLERVGEHLLLRLLLRFLFLLVDGRHPRRRPWRLLHHVRPIAAIAATTTAAAATTVIINVHSEDVARVATRQPYQIARHRPQRRVRGGDEARRERVPKEDEGRTGQ